MIPYDPKWPNYKKDERIRVLALMKEHHPEKVSAYYKAHYARHRTNNLERMRRYRTENPEKVIAIRRKTYAKNRESLIARSKAFYHANKQAIHAQRCEEKFGLGVGGYLKLFSSQGGKCAICESSHVTGNKRFPVDHCHKTGKVRAILCHRCNAMLGMAKDNPEILRRAAAYIEIHAE